MEFKNIFSHICLNSNDKHPAYDRCEPIQTNNFTYYTVENLINLNRLLYTSDKLQLIDLHIKIN